MTSRRKFLTHAVLTLAVTLATTMLPAGSSHAQAWPSAPIHVIVPLPAGGGSDFLARLLAEELPSVLGQPLIVENRVGAGGRIGIEYASKQLPDGHTLLFITNMQLVQSSLFAKLPYDIMQDFDPVSMMAQLSVALLVSPGVPAHSVKDYVALARAKPGYVTFGSSGIGSPFHLGGELLKSMAGVDMLHVPYRGSAQLTLALISGEVMSVFAPLHMAFLPSIRAGKLRALGVGTAERTPLLPDVPTIAESAPLPGYALDSWLGVVVPTGTPKPIVDRLSGAIAALVKDPAFEKRWGPQGWQPVGSTPEEMRAQMKGGLTKYAKIVKDAKIPPQ